MKTEITEFRGVKFGEASKDVRPLQTGSDGILWHDKLEDLKIGIVRVSDIKYGFYKGKFMKGKVNFGGVEVNEILTTALTEKYGTPSNPLKDGNCWVVGNVKIELQLGLWTLEGTLVYEFIPLSTELEEELYKKKKEEKKMKVNAAKSDL
jgi:hypothetical protein